MRAPPWPGSPGIRAVTVLLALCIVGTGGTGAYVVTTAVEPPGSILGVVHGGGPGGSSAGRTPADSRARAAPLKRIIPPTMMAVARQPISRKELRRIRRLDEVQEATTFAAGQVRLAGRRLNMLAVTASTFRSWTPPPTASSDGLWRGLAHGELAVSFAARKTLDLQLGHAYTVNGRQTRQLHLGAAAGFGLPGLDAVVNMRTGTALGLVPNLGVLVNAPGADLGALKRSLREIVGRGARVRGLRQQLPTGTSTRSASPGAPRPSGGSGRSSAAPRSGTSGQGDASGRDGASGQDGRPRTYKQLYKQAAQRCPGLSWTVLAAIGQVESGHGRNMGPSRAGALGPMQFMPGTWRKYGIDGDGDGAANIMSPYDAVPSAARYLCAHGAGGESGDLRDAVFAYNHAWWYVREVLNLAQRYAAA